MLPTGTVTFLFTDIQGSTPLWEHAPEKMAEALQVHNRTLWSTIEANGGVVFKVVGDAFNAAFPTAMQALRAGIEGQKALQTAPWNELGPLRVRMGLHTGEAELDPGGDEYAVSHTKNRVSRIMSAGQGGQILLSQETTDLVRRTLPEGVILKDLGEHRLKGMEWLEHLYQVGAPGLPQEFPPLTTGLIHPNNLPVEMSHFIGRGHEIIQITGWILSGSQRLVTLTGSGGTGKTRLALRVGAEVLAGFPDGVWLVELAPLSDPDLVARTIAQALGLREVPGIPIETVLAGYLQNKRVLLILDNCEHLLVECSRMADLLLKKCARVQLLATSREFLGVAGEMPFRVPSLAAPDPKHLPGLDELACFEAVQLFLDRAAQTGAGFTLQDDNAEAVATICRRLDGIPLAIELAAARIRVMAPQQIAARLDHVFRLLTGGSRSVLPRQQTLKATIDWSYALLTERERLALQQFSVFAGSWTLEAAEAVASGADIEPFEVLDLLTSLLDKSLNQAIPCSGGSTRYRMLETVRQYAHDRLLESGAGEQVRDRHLAYYLALAEQAEPHLRGKGQLEWLCRLEDEHDNLQLALEWSLVGHIEDGLRLASSLMWFWHIRTYQGEGIAWLETLLDAESRERGCQPLAVGSQSTAFLRVWSRAVSAIGDLAIFYSSSIPFDRRIALLKESIVLCRAIGPDASSELARALITLGCLSLDLERSNQYLEESLRICRLNGYLFNESECLYFLINNAIDSGKFMLAKERAELSLAICRQLEDLEGIASRLIWLSLISGDQGDWTKANTLFQEGQEYYQRVGNMVMYYYDLVERIMYFNDPDSFKEAEAALLYFKERQNVLVWVHALVIFIAAEWSAGNYERAERFGEEAAPFISTHSLDSILFLNINILYSLWLGRLALSQGDYHPARQNFKDMLSWVKVESGVKPLELVYVLDALAVWLSTEGRLVQAVQIFAAVDEVYQRFAVGLLPRVRSEHDSALAAARATLGEAAFAQSCQAGKSLTMWQALEAFMQAEGWEDEHA